MGKSRALIFTSYEKIATSPSQWYLDETGYRLLEKIDWVVTEKIHGANFCFILDGATIICANRKQILSKDDDFFHYQALLVRLRDKLQRVMLLVKERSPQAERVFLYGELFGGAYPHPDVPPDPSVQAIQSGIYYAPTIEFCAFDMAIEGTNQQRAYLDYDQVIAICKATDLLYAVPLFIGSYKDALDYPIGFRSTISALLGLPPLTEENRAEGVVIKPLKTLILETSKGRIRPVLKKKIPEFSEDKRFNMAQKWSIKQTEGTFDRLEQLKWEAFNQITENRLESAISKVGSIGKGGQGKASKVFSVFVEDVLEQLAENQRELFATLTECELSELTLSIQEEARLTLKNYFHKNYKKQC